MLCVLFSVFQILVCQSAFPAVTGSDRGSSVAWADAHDYHVSIAELDYDSRRGHLALAVHLFTDDLEMALEAAGAGDSLFLGTEFERADADRWLRSYLAENLALELDGHRVEWSFLGRENSEDLMAQWVYLEADVQDAPGKNWLLRNELLMDLYRDQKNLVHLRVDRERRTTMFFSRRKTLQSYVADR